MTNDPFTPRPDPAGEPDDLTGPVDPVDPVDPTDVLGPFDGPGSAGAGPDDGDPVPDGGVGADPTDPGPAGAEREDQGGGTATATATPPPPPVGPRRLVRDPYSRLGGVASGVAHYYGIDVSLVRILFIVVALATGFGLLAYLLAWIIIPRADYWPPAAPNRTLHRLSNRELGTGLAIIGLVLALIVGAGATGSILIPLVLVGGGVWLLVQRPDDPPPPVAGSEQPAPPVDTYGSAGGYGSPGIGAAAPVGEPVPPRSGRRRGFLIALLVAFLVLIVLPIVAGLAFVVSVAGRPFPTSSVDRRITPDTVAELPIDADHEAGEIVVDLRQLEAADFDGTESIRVDVDFGTVTVIVPDDLTVDVDASVGVGSLEVFGITEDGIGNDVDQSREDADVDLDLDVGFGEVHVVRR